MGRPRVKPRYLVRVDPEIYRDIKWVRNSIGARASYFDSLFYLAAAGEPDGFYPHAELVATAGLEAERTAYELTTFGVWEFVGLGYRVRSYNGCGIVLEQRAAIPAVVRRLVFARDGHRCLECGATDDLTLDHIIPWSKDGPDTEDNLRVLCRSCNSRKGARV